MRASIKKVSDCIYNPRDFAMKDCYESGLGPEKSMRKSVWTFIAVGVSILLFQFAGAAQDAGPERQPQPKPQSK